MDQSDIEWQRHIWRARVMFAKWWFIALLFHNRTEIRVPHAVAQWVFDLVSREGYYEEIGIGVIDEHPRAYLLLRGTYDQVNAPRSLFPSAILEHHHPLHFFKFPTATLWTLVLPEPGDREPDDLLPNFLPSRRDLLYFAGDCNPLKTYHRVLSRDGASLLCREGPKIRLFWAINPEVKDPGMPAYVKQTLRAIADYAIVSRAMPSRTPGNTLWPSLRPAHPNFAITFHETTYDRLLAREFRA